MKRNNVLDIAKGIAISLMVIGHCYSGWTAISTLIYAFHMPFFFIVSGILYSYKWKDNVSISFVRLSRKLIVPYLFFDILSLLFILILKRSSNIVDEFANGLLSNTFSFVGTTTTWFLPCQLLTVLMSALVIKMTQKKANFVGVIIFAILFLFAVSTPTPGHYWVVLWRIFVGMGFFAIGYYGSAYIVREASSVTTVLCSAVFVGTAIINGQISLASLEFSNPILYLINGILGTFIICQLCYALCKNKCAEHVFSILGQNSIVILCTHMFAVEIIRLADYKLFNNLLYHLGLLEGFVFGGMVLFLMWIVIPLCNRYCKLLFGK